MSGHLDVDVIQYANTSLVVFVCRFIQHSITCISQFALPVYYKRSSLDYQPERPITSQGLFLVKYPSCCTMGVRPFIELGLRMNQMEFLNFGRKHEDTHGC